MAAAPRKLTRIAVYTRNDARVIGRYVKRPPNGVPRRDTIELAFQRTRPPGRLGRWSIWLRPDEAVAVSAVMAAAAWDAQVSRRR